MSTTFAFVIGLLQAALTLLGFVHANPSLPQATQDQAVQTAQQAISQATQALSQQPAYNSVVINSFTGVSSTANGLSFTFTWNSNATQANGGGCYLRPTIVTGGLDGGQNMNTGTTAYGPPSGTVTIQPASDYGNFTLLCTSAAKEGSPSATKQTVVTADISTISVPGTSKECIIGVNCDRLNSAVGPFSLISVPGMSKYTDPDFGFSFWYPSGWRVSVSSVSPTEIEQLSGFRAGNGNSIDPTTIVKTLQVKTAGQDTLYIQEINSSSGMESMAGPGVHFYFNTTTATWVDNSNQTNLNQPSVVFHPSNVTYTMGGLPILWTGFVALSADTFVTVAVDDGGNPYMGPTVAPLPLLKTITATNSSVATPVSAAQQQATIQAEQQAYAGQ